MRHIPAIVTKMRVGNRQCDEGFFGKSAETPENRETERGNLLKFMLDF